MSNVLELNNVSRHFEQGSEKLEILKSLSLNIKKGEIVGLVGQSGTGKSTLLQIAGLLEPPNTGDVLIEGNKIKLKDDKTRTNLRGNKIGFIYQSHHLLSDFTALENVMMPMLIAGKSKSDAEKVAIDLIDRVGLKDRINHIPAKLSGGEQQRIAIARALSNDPVLILGDEPTGNLDPKTSDIVFDIMLNSVRKSEVGALIVTHNIEIAKKMDRVLELKNGKVVAV